MIELTVEEGRELHDYLRRRGFLEYWKEVVQIRIRMGQDTNVAVKEIDEHPLFNAFWKLNGKDKCQQWLHNQLMENSNV